MNEAIKEETVGFLFNTEVQVAPPAAPALQPVAIGDMLRGLDAEDAPQVPGLRRARSPGSRRSRGRRGCPEATAEGCPARHREGARRAPSRAPPSLLVATEDGGVEERDESPGLAPLTTDQLAMAKRNEFPPLPVGRKYKILPRPRPVAAVTSDRPRGVSAI